MLLVHIESPCWNRFFKLISLSCLIFIMYFFCLYLKSKVNISILYLTSEILKSIKCLLGVHLKSMLKWIFQIDITFMFDCHCMHTNTSEQDVINCWHVPLGCDNFLSWSIEIRRCQKHYPHPFKPFFAFEWHVFFFVVYLVYIVYNLYEEAPFCVSVVYKIIVPHVGEFINCEFQVNCFVHVIKSTKKETYKAIVAIG